MPYYLSGVAEVGVCRGQAALRGKDVGIMAEFLCHHSILHLLGLASGQLHCPSQHHHLLNQVLQCPSTFHTLGKVLSYTMY